MKTLPELDKRMIAVIMVIAVLSVIGTVLALGSGSIRLADVFRSLENAGPRAIGFLALPFVIVAVLVGAYYFKKREERMWKNALKRTRAQRERQSSSQDPAPE